MDQINGLGHFLDKERDFLQAMVDLLALEKSLRKDVLDHESYQSLFNHLYPLVESQIIFLLFVEDEALEHPSNRRWSNAFSTLRLNSHVYQNYASLNSERKAIRHTDIRQCEKDDIHLPDLEQCIKHFALPTLRLKEHERFINVFLLCFT